MALSSVWPYPSQTKQEAKNQIRIVAYLATDSRTPFVLFTHHMWIGEFLIVIAVRIQPIFW